MGQDQKPTLNLNFSQFFTGKYGWIKATIMIVLILLSAAVAAHEGANVSVNLSLDARVSAIENTLNIPVNSSLSAFRKSNSYMISLVDTYACFQNGSNGGLRQFITNHTAAIQWALGNASVSGGSVYISEGSYSASVILENNTRLVIDKGATGVTVTSVAAGANCILEDFNNNVFKYYSNGSVQTVFDYASGNLLTTSANLTTVYVGALDPFTGGYVSIYKLVVENGTGYPASPQVGQLFYRTDLYALYYWNSTAWAGCGGGGGGGGSDDDNLYLLTASASNFLFQNGSRPLTADWNAGAYGVYGCTWLNSTNFDANFWFWNNLNRTDVLATPITSYSYLVDVSGSTCRMKNGTTGQIDYQSTNATNTINFALGNGTTVLLAPGNFSITGTLMLNKSQTRLIGSGVGITWLIPTGLIRNSFLTTPWSTQISSVQISDISLDCKSQTSNDTTASGIGLGNVTNAVVGNVFITGCEQAGLYFTNCQNALAEHVTFNNGSGGDDIVINGGAHEIFLQDCFSQNQEHRVTGFSAAYEVEAGAYDVFFDNCFAVNGTDTGFNFHTHTGESAPVHDLYVSNCGVDTMQNYSYRGTPESPSTLRPYNLFFSNDEANNSYATYTGQGDGFSFTSCDGVHISNCHADGNHRDGLLFSDCTNFNMNGGDSTNNGANGINLYGSVNGSTIGVNVLYNSQTSAGGASGIYLGNGNNNTLISTCTFEGLNQNYCIDISASSCTNNQIGQSDYIDYKTQAVHNLGTGTNKKIQYELYLSEPFTFGISTNISQGTANRTYLCPIIVPYLCSIDRVVAYIRGTSNGTSVAGIYNDNGTNSPQGASLIVSSSSTAKPGTWRKFEVTITATQLNPGVYWVALMGNDTTSALGTVDSAVLAGGTLLTYYFDSATYGTLPSTCPTITAGVGPVFSLRVASIP